MGNRIEYIDVRGKEDGHEFAGPGTILVMQPHDTEFWKLGPAKEADVGMDLPVRIKGIEDPDNCPKLFPPMPGFINKEEGWIDIPAGAYARIPSGIYTKMPDDSWMMVRPRSSTGFKIFLDTFEGTVDPGYTGHLLALVYNRYNLVSRVSCLLKYGVCRIVSLISPSLARYVARAWSWGALRVRDGDRLIQIVLVPKYELQRVVFTDTLPKTERGATRFGSSGGLAGKQPEGV